ncbi:acyl carrier protein [Alteromonas sp. ASW11-130]|uniref:acyl carrier protein n=1 Tax=Alteromonas sp. ASW11-130 TaxID=3015775 RepID=UPI002242BFF3|nr:acyl carrier protein [Alteromonas sp. ASW11-130]MCW8090714.1 acyl carrier protein [Alteromonas sp. ASW11-130]
MDKSEVIEKIKEALHDSMNLPDAELSSSTKLVEDLNADSVDFATLLMELEEVFNCKIPDSAGAEISDATIGQVADYIIKLKQA